MGVKNKIIVEELLTNYVKSGFFNNTKSIERPSASNSIDEDPLRIAADGPGTATIRSIVKTGNLVAIGGVINAITSIFNFKPLNNGMPANIILAKGVLGGTVFPYAGFSFPGTQVTDMSVSVAVPYKIRQATPTKPGLDILLILNYAVNRPEPSNPFSTVRILGGAEVDIQFPFATNIRKEFRDFYEKKGFFKDGRLPLLDKMLSARIVQEKDKVDFWSITFTPAFAAGFLASYRENTLTLASYFGGGISISAKPEPATTLNTVARGTYEVVKNFILPVYYYWVPWAYSIVNQPVSARPYHNTIVNLLDILLRNSGYRTNLLRNFSTQKGTFNMTVGTFNAATKEFRKTGDAVSKAVWFRYGENDASAGQFNLGTRWFAPIWIQMRYVNGDGRQSYEIIFKKNWFEKPWAGARTTSILPRDVYIKSSNDGTNRPIADLPQIGWASNIRHGIYSNTVYKLVGEILQIWPSLYASRNPVYVRFVGQNVPKQGLTFAWATSTRTQVNLGVFLNPAFATRVGLHLLDNNKKIITGVEFNLNATALNWRNSRRGFSNLTYYAGYIRPTRSSSTDQDQANSDQETKILVSSTERQFRNYNVQAGVILEAGINNAFIGIADTKNVIRIDAKTFRNVVISGNGSEFDLHDVEILGNARIELDSNGKKVITSKSCAHYFINATNITIENTSVENVPGSRFSFLTKNIGQLKFNNFTAGINGSVLDLSGLFSTRQLQALSGIISPIREDNNVSIKLNNGGEILLFEKRYEALTASNFLNGPQLINPITDTDTELYFYRVLINKDVGPVHVFGTGSEYYVQNTNVEFRFNSSDLIRTANYFSVTGNASGRFLATSDLAEVGVINYTSENDIRVISAAEFSRFSVRSERKEIDLSATQLIGNVIVRVAHNGHVAIGSALSGTKFQLDTSNASIVFKSALRDQVTLKSIDEGFISIDGMQTGATGDCIDLSELSPWGGSFYKFDDLKSELAVDDEGNTVFDLANGKLRISLKGVDKNALTENNFILPKRFDSDMFPDQLQPTRLFDNNAALSLQNTTPVYQVEGARNQYTIASGNVKFLFSRSHDPRFNDFFVKEGDAVLEALENSTVIGLRNFEFGGHAYISSGGKKNVSVSLDASSGLEFDLSTAYGAGVVQINVDRAGMKAYGFMNGSLFNIDGANQELTGAIGKSDIYSISQRASGTVTLRNFESKSETPDIVDLTKLSSITDVNALIANARSTGSGTTINITNSLSLAFEGVSRDLLSVHYFRL